MTLGEDAQALTPAKREVLKLVGLIQRRAEITVVRLHGELAVVVSDSIYGAAYRNRTDT